MLSHADIPISEPSKVHRDTVEVHDLLSALFDRLLKACATASILVIQVSMYMVPDSGTYLDRLSSPASLVAEGSISSQSFSALLWMHAFKLWLDVWVKCCHALPCSSSPKPCQNLQHNLEVVKNNELIKGNTLLTHRYINFRSGARHRYWETFMSWSIACTPARPQGLVLVACDWYRPQVLGCDLAANVRVWAYLGAQLNEPHDPYDCKNDACFCTGCWHWTSLCLCLRGVLLQKRRSGDRLGLSRSHQCLEEDPAYWDFGTSSQAKPFGLCHNNPHSPCCFWCPRPRRLHHEALKLPPCE